MRQTLTVSQWTDRCATALGRQLPNIDPTEAFARACELQREAYELDPAEAAEIYALELAPADIGAPGDERPAVGGAPVLSFVADGVDAALRQRAVAAAMQVFARENVSPISAIEAQFRLEGIGMRGESDERLNAAESQALKVWNSAREIAFGVCGLDRFTAPAEVGLEVWFPEKVRWEAARKRWLERKGMT